MSTTWSDDHFIAGEAVLDFANTVYRRTPELGADLLDSTNALMSWLRHAELLPSPHEAPDRLDGSEAALSDARVTRTHFWAIFEARKDGRQLPPDASPVSSTRRAAASVATSPWVQTVPQRLSPRRARSPSSRCAESGWR
jgi:hypothetical protein